MENWWFEHNGALTPLPTVAPTNNMPNTFNYSRIWMPSIPNQNFHASTIYDSNGLQAATVDTFIESFTQLTESISTNALYNHASSNYPYLDNSAIHMANYRAITQYYNSRRIDINTNISAPLVTTNRYVNQGASFLNQHFRYLMPTHSPPVTIQQKTSANFYPNWKNYQKQSSTTLPNFPFKKEDFKWIRGAQWNDVPPASNSLNSSSSESDVSYTTTDDSDCDKSVGAESVEEKRRKDNAKKFQEYMNRFYDYTNPYCCEFCEILDRAPSKRILEFHDQQLLLKNAPVNPHEFTDGIKTVLSWPVNKEFVKMDGLTAFYLDDHKRKMKELFPHVDFNANKNNCVVRGCNCRQYAMTLASQEIRLALMPTSNRQQGFDDFLKITDQSTFVKGGQLESPEENLRRRMAEFVCLGPINSWWNAAGGGDAERLSYTCDSLSQEKLQELLLRRVQMKPRNRM